MLLILVDKEVILQSEGRIFKEFSLYGYRSWPLIDVIKYEGLSLGVILADWSNLVDIVPEYSIAHHIMECDVVSHWEYV